MRVSYIHTRAHRRLPSQYIKSHAVNKMLMVLNEADEEAADRERSRGRVGPARGYRTASVEKRDNGNSFRILFSGGWTSDKLLPRVPKKGAKKFKSLTFHLRGWSWECLIFSEWLLSAASHSSCTVDGGRCVSGHHSNQKNTQKRLVVAILSFQNFILAEIGSAELLSLPSIRNCPSATDMSFVKKRQNCSVISLICPTPEVPCSDLHI